MSNLKQTEPDKPRKGKKFNNPSLGIDKKGALSPSRDPLAYRLSDIMIRLFMGEKILLTDLASEFNVSERTIYRDLHERLAMLDIECQDKRYFLSKRQYGARLTASDLVRFAKMTYVDRLFPVLDNKLATILTHQEVSPFIVYTYPPKTSIKPFGAFLLITEAILTRQCLLFELDPAKANLPSEVTTQLTSSAYVKLCLTQDKPFHPYRLVYVSQEWFLVGCHQGQLWVCRYEDLTNVKRLTSTFKVSSLLLNMIESEPFIQTLPHYALLRAVMGFKVT